MNIMQILAQLRQSSNPQQFLIDMIEKNAAQDNPMYSNMIKLMKENKYDEIEKIGRNIAREKGINFDEEFAKFKQMLGL